MYLGIQETQLTDTSKIDIRDCWGNGDFGHVATSSTRRSGGLLNIWDSSLYQVDEIIKARQFLITIGECSGIQGQMVFANIYGPHNSQEKKKLWEDIRHIRAMKKGIWVIFRDFNTVRRECERYNSQFDHSEAFWFNRFIDLENLHDLRMGGSGYTYCCRTDIKMSKLNRFQVCKNCMEIFPNVSAIALPRELSDHCPINLRTADVDFGKAPFRFFNSWMKCEGCEHIIQGAWEKFRGYSTPDAYLAAKLRYLKREIKIWRANDYPREMKEFKELKERTHKLEIDAKNCILLSDEINE